MVEFEWILRLNKLKKNIEINLFFILLLEASSPCVLLLLRWFRSSGRLRWEESFSVSGLCGCRRPASPFLNTGKNPHLETSYRFKENCRQLLKSSVREMSPWKLYCDDPGKHWFDQGSYACKHSVAGNRVHHSAITSYTETDCLLKQDAQTGSMLLPKHPEIFKVSI